jgi:hypothetical protein
MASNGLPKTVGSGLENEQAQEERNLVARGRANEAPLNGVGIALYCQTVNKKETSVIRCLADGATEFGMGREKGDRTSLLRNERPLVIRKRCSGVPDIAFLLSGF